MDKISLYQSIIKAYFQECLSYISGNNNSLWNVIIDTEQANFLLLSSGWQKGRHIHFIALHIEIIADKVWIQCNGTEWQVATELIERGIVTSDIVLGFVAPNLREYTKFAGA